MEEAAKSGGSKSNGLKLSDLSTRILTTDAKFIKFYKQEET